MNLPFSSGPPANADEKLATFELNRVDIIN
jgi:hypothetical protein